MTLCLCDLSSSIIRFCLLTIVYLLFSLTFTINAHAASCTAQATGNWNDTNTWTCGAIPGSGDTVTINAAYTVTVTADAAASSLSVTAGTLAVGTYNLAVTGDSTVTGGTLTIGASSGTGWTTANLTIGANGTVTATGAAKVTIAGNYDQSSTSSKFAASSATITVNGNGTFTADGTVDQTQYNGASIVLNGANLLTYVNQANNSSNGFFNLTGGQSGNATTLASTIGFAILNTLTVGTGSIARTTGSNAFYLYGATPLSVDSANSRISVSLNFCKGNGSQTIPELTNGYDSPAIADMGSNSIITQTGNVTLNGTGTFVLGTGGGAGVAAAKIQTWKTDGYNFTVVGGNLQIGAGADSGLKQFDATRNVPGARTSTISVGGNWLNYGTGTAPSQFIADNSNVILNSTAVGKTVTSGTTNSPFYNIQFNGTGGAWTLQDNLTATNSTLTAGNLIDNGKTVTVNGNISIGGTANLLTSTGSWIQGASGNISNPTNTNSFYSLTMAGAGVTSTLTGHVNVGRGTSGGYITLGPGTLTGNYSLAVTPSVNDAITVNNLTAGSLINELYILPAVNNLTQKAITLPNNFVSTFVRIDTVWETQYSASGNWNLGNNPFNINNEGTSTPTHYFNMGSSALTAGNLTLGNGSNQTGYIKLGSSASHSVASIASWTNTITGNVLDLGSSTTSVSGNINFTGISVTPGTSTVNLNGTSTQSVTSAGQTYNNLTITNATTNAITFADGFTTANFSDSVPSSVLRFPNSGQYNITGLLTLNGHGKNTRINLDTTNGSAPKFIFNVSSPQNVSYVNVNHSEASGKNIVATNSVNGGTNDTAEAVPHWVFGSGGSLDLGTVF
ncbi:MAG: hypothetical protein HQL26_10640 [Candidatus Omnitrophica bacterium]|nr:hypothetical protein [Candidatus Omnitrophota bacterium]